MGLTQGPLGAGERSTPGQGPAQDQQPSRPASTVGQDRRKANGDVPGAPLLVALSRGGEGLLGQGGSLTPGALSQVDPGPQELLSAF